jgi:hypothetical protein
VGDLAGVEPRFALCRNGDVSQVLRDAAALLNRKDYFEPSGTVDVDVDSALLGILFAAEGGASGMLSPLEFLMAEMVLQSNSFHAAIHETLSPFGDVASAPMKKYNRAAAKVGLHGDYFNQPPGEPYCRHLKDILRTSIFVQTHEQLANAYAALEARFGKPAVTKNRLLDAPHDILTVVWFNGVLCEVQLHLKQVHGLKAFSHAAYNVIRCQTNDVADLKTLFDFPRIDLDKVGYDKGRASVTCKLQI